MTNDKHEFDIGQDCKPNCDCRCYCADSPRTAAEDYEIAKLKLKAEESLVDNSNMLGRLAPLIIRIVTDPNKFNCAVRLGL